MIKKRNNKNKNKSSNMETNTKALYYEPIKIFILIITTTITLKKS